jgi:hypothetical protein
MFIYLFVFFSNEAFKITLNLKFLLLTFNLLMILKATL